jgi:hypothetical protein
MANLSQDDRAVITKYPLDDCLGHLRGSLEKVEQSYEGGDTRDRGASKAVLRLLYTLQGHDVALALRSKTRSGDLASELYSLLRRVQNNNFNYGQYRPLFRLVIQQALDFDIWNAVFDLIRSISQTTPPTSIPPSFDGTLIIYSSALMQGEEQTKRLLENSLFDEIRNCTYQNVEGFFPKYFKGRKWSKRSKEIYQVLKHRHVEGRWFDFPDRSSL